MKSIFPLLLIFGLIYCGHARVKMENPPQVETKVVKKKYYYYFWGYSPAEFSVDLKEFCESGTFLYEFHSYHSFSSTLVSVVTLGTVLPLDVEVTCGSKIKK